MTESCSNLVAGLGANPDIIIVGGGTAGLVLAARLSEDPNTHVLVVEAGANHRGDPKVDIPGLMTQLYEDEKYDWKFMTKPQDGLHGRQIAWPRGKMLGGSSGINFCAMLYPSCADFEAWTKLGNKGWSSSDMLSSFCKSQTHYPPEAEVAKRMQLNKCVDTDLERHDGPLPVSYLKGYGKAHQAWVQAFTELGFDVPGDPIHGKKLGAFTNPVAIDPVSQTRAYSAAAYYKESIAARPNLQVLTETVVQRVILDKHEDESVVATGIEILTKDGQNATIKINEGGEVIVSAGTVQSPQLLELSGIGDENILRRHNIPVVVPNPHVGENLQDHPLSAVSLEVVDANDSGDIMREPENQMAAFEQYQSTKSGPLSGAHLTFAYIPLVDKDGRVETTQIQDMLQKYLWSTNEPVEGSKELQYKILTEMLMNKDEASGEYMLIPMQLNTNSEGPTDMSVLFTPRTPGNYITLVAMLNRPFSRGSVHIRSADPRDYPEVDPRYLAHPLDLEILARHTQFIENIAKTGPMSKVLKENGRRIPEGCDLTDLDAAKQVAMDRCFTAFHPCGTCAMMPKEQGGVVNDRLVVYGTKNLRVVDASIFPIVPVGNILATVYATAEHAADIIKEDRAQKLKH